MTYRELLELYKAGELELEQRKRIEKDIEKQEAISDYLYEQEGIPGLEDVFKEEQNSSVFADGRQRQGKRKQKLMLRNKEREVSEGRTRKEEVPRKRISIQNLSQ